MMIPNPVNNYLSLSTLYFFGSTKKCFIRCTNGLYNLPLPKTFRIGCGHFVIHEPMNIFPLWWHEKSLPSLTFDRSPITLAGVRRLQKTQSLQPNGSRLTQAKPSQRRIWLHWPNRASLQFVCMIQNHSLVGKQVVIILWFHKSMMIVCWCMLSIRVPSNQCIMGPRG